MKLRVLVVVFLGALAPALLAQQLSVRVTTDSTSVLIGEWIPVSLEVEAPNDVTLYLPSSDEDVDGAYFVSAEDERRDDSQGVQFIRRDMTLTVFDTGRIDIAVLVRYRLPDDTTMRVARSKALTIAIRGVELDTSITFKDIRDVLHVSLTIWDYLLYVGIIALLAVLGFFAYRWYTRRPVKEEVEEEAPVVIIPPHIVALQALHHLREEAIWKLGEHKEYQTRLSEILRTYIENRYELPAMEQTTGEILRAIAVLPIDPDLLTKLEHTLRIADFTKFAKYQPSAVQHEDGLNFGFDFVNATAEQTVPPEGGDDV